MKRIVFAIVMGSVLASALPYAASAGPNGIDIINRYELNKKKAVSSDQGFNLDELTSGSINRRYYGDDLNRHKNIKK